VATRRPVTNMEVASLERALGATGGEARGAAAAHADQRPGPAYGGPGGDHQAGEGAPGGEAGGKARAETPAVTRAAGRPLLHLAPAPDQPRALSVPRRGKRPRSSWR